MSYRKQSVVWVVLVALEDSNILVGEIIMTERTVYKCEICGQEYDEEELALKCEASHDQAVFIRSQKWEKTEHYPKYLEVHMYNGHKMLYELVKPLIDPPVDEPFFTDIVVSRDAETNQVVMTAVGNKVPEFADYTWIIFCDDNRLVATTARSTVILSESATAQFDAATEVIVKVDTAGLPSGQFVVKE